MSEVYWGLQGLSVLRGQKGIGASGGIGWLLVGVGGHFGVSSGEGVSKVYWGLAGTLSTQGPEGV